MNLLDLPLDVWLEVFCWLDSDSLHACLLVSASLRNFLKSHPQFEYAYRLEKQGMVDVCASKVPYEARLRMLQQFAKSWKATIRPKPPTSSYHIGGDCVAYELVAGIFAKTDGSSLTLQWLPSPTAPAKQLQISPKELGFPIKDFALDPTQDLVVMIEAGHLPLVFPHGRQINLHLRRLSTNAPHPAARKRTISFHIPYNPRGNDLQAITVQLADDLLSLFFFTGPGSSHLILWDWRMGNVILNSLHPGTRLPDTASSFELLSPRSYAIFTLANNGGISIYNIAYPHDPIVPPSLVATLRFPGLLPEVQLTSVYSHTGPFLARPRRGMVFTTDPESRVYIISLRLLNSSRHHATLFVDHSAFLPYIKLGYTTNEPLEVPWHTWSHQRLYFVPTSVSSNWLRYVQGTRVLTVMDVAARGNTKVVVWDFNKHEKVQVAPTRDGPYVCKHRAHHS